LEKALLKFKRRRDFEVGKLRSFRKLQQEKAKAQRVTWRKKYQNQYHTMRSYADMLKQQKEEVDQHTKSLKKALREVELLKVELTNKIKHSSGDESNLNSENAYPRRIHETIKTQQLPTFLPPAGIPPEQQYIVIPSSAIQQIAQPSYPGHQSFREEYPALIGPPTPARPVKSQKSRGKPSHIKPRQKRQ
jgi:hypothetical protein